MLSCRIRAFLFLIASALLVSFRVDAREKIENDSSRTNTIINLTYNCEFNHALTFVDDLASEDTASLKWKFFRAFVLWQEVIFIDSVGAADQNVEAQFSNSIGRVIDDAEVQLSQNPSDTTALFYAGFSLGVLAKFDAAKGDKWKAAREGNKGLSYHKKLISICPRWYDAYFSGALFNYYTCVLPWYLKPLLFFLGQSGSRDMAYELLTLVSSKGSIAKYEADNILGELYERELKFDSASTVYSKLISQFPKATLYYVDRILWSLTEANRYQEVVQKCKETIKILPTWHLSHWDSLYVGKIYFRLADAYEKLGDYGNAMGTYGELIDHYVTISEVSEAHLSIGRLYEKANDSQDAIREYIWVANKADSPQLSKEARERLENLGVR
ncbi:MAG TPA: tetratricopeptide repeat protein [Candidatus Acidoferrales bacterium]|nr:tetratricopeptide repeat protein [Candidatus Acidoferrales bacterium]